MIQKNLWKKIIVVSIIVIFLGSSFAAGFTINPKRNKETLAILIDNNKLSNDTVSDSVHSLQELLDYHKQVIAEEEQYAQLIEEEYLLQRDSFRASHEYLSDHPSIAYADYASDGIVENHVPKLRPLPTGNILYVGGNGSGNYSKIQDAINDASDGDTVFVYNDSSPYYENIVVNKSIFLFGENKNSTVIDGMANGKEVVKINTDYVHVGGFTIRNCWCGILIFYSSNNILSDNIVTNNVGVGIVPFGTHNTISDNTIINNSGNGIWIYTYSDNNVSGNTIANNAYGIRLIQCDHNTIISNTIIQNRYSGITLFRCNFSEILNNICCSNRIDGIGLDYYNLANTIENNTCLNNMKGIAIRDFSFLNQLRNNTCDENLQGILLNNASFNIITDNMCSYNSIAIYLYNSRLNFLSKNHCNHSDYDGIVLEHSGFNIIKNNDAGPYNYIGIVIQTSTFNWLLHNDVYQNVGYGIVLLKTIGNHLHFNNFNNVYNKAQKDLLGLLCFDNARGNYWTGGAAPHKLVLGWVRVCPWLRNPVEDSRNLDDIVMNDMSTLQEFRALSSSLIKRELSYPIKSWIN